MIILILKNIKNKNTIVLDFDLDHPYKSSSEMNCFSINEIINLSKCKKLYLTGGNKLMIIV